MDKDRVLHSLSVANKCVEIGKSKGLSEEELSDLFLLGYVHDIGYQYDKNNHAEAGSIILKNNGFKYYKEVEYHGKVDSEYQSLYLDILNYADMNIDKYGNDVGFEKRLEDIKSRYGEESKVYINCVNLINELKEKGW